MAHRVKLILNPMADMGHAWTVANDLRPLIQQHGGADWSGTVYPTHATELAQQAAEQGYQRVIALGGDGTVHEVINGLMRVPAEKRPLLGVVPVGSGNDFAYALGIPDSPSQALQIALTGQPRAVDIGFLQSPDHTIQEYFDNTLGIGFDAVVTIRSHRLPLVRGFLMYLTATLQSIIMDHHPLHFRLEMPGKTQELDALMLTFCNGGREGGGFMLAPEARMDDGLLDILSVANVSRPLMLRLLAEFMRGTHLRYPQVQLQQAKEIHVQTDAPMYIHADGEILTSFGSDIRTLQISILPGALQVAAPH